MKVYFVSPKSIFRELFWSQRNLLCLCDTWFEFYIWIPMIGVCYGAISMCRHFSFYPPAFFHPLSSIYLFLSFFSLNDTIYQLTLIYNGKGEYESSTSFGLRSLRKNEIDLSNWGRGPLKNIFPCFHCFQMIFMCCKMNPYFVSFGLFNLRCRLYIAV